MNYYPHHIGDFRSGTFNMTRQERWIYRDMLDVYYDTEKPFPDDLGKICQLVGARDATDKEVVAAILLLKFTLTDAGYIHERCDIEIANYKARAEIAQSNGKKGGRPPKKTQTKPSDNPAGSEQVTDGNPAETGLKANQEPITIINTPIPPEGGNARPKRRSATSFPDYLAQCKRDDALPIPEDCAVFDYADKAGIPRDFLRLHWLEFKDRYSEPDAKKYKTWPAVFCKSVRGNWFKLWFADKGGGYSLSTTGAQAEMIHKGKT